MAKTATTSMTDDEALAAAMALAEGPAPTVQSSPTTVVIACKLPHGIVMEMGVKEEPNYRSYVINGANASRVFGGYGLTGGIPKDFADAWFEKNKNIKMVRNHLVYQEGEEKSAIAHAKETRHERTGLEAWNPEEATKAKGSKLDIDPNYRKQVAANPERRSHGVEMLDA